MQHTMMTFRLHKQGVFLLVFGAFLLGSLLYMAGCLVGQRRAGGGATSRPSPPHLPAVAAVRPAVPRSPAEPEPKRTFALRAGAFTEEAEAKALVQALAARGLEPFLAPVATSGGAVLHTVLVGGYASREDAAAAASELARREGLSAIVVAARPERDPIRE